PGTLRNTTPDMVCRHAGRPATNSSLHMASNDNSHDCSGVGELCAYRMGIGVVEVGQDGQGSPPCGPGRAYAPSRLMAVAGVREGRGLLVALAELAVQREGLAEAARGVRVVAEMVVRVPQTVQCGRLTGTMVQLLQQDECLPAGGHRGGVIA